MYVKKLNIPRISVVDVEIYTNSTDYYGSYTSLCVMESKRWKIGKYYVTYWVMDVVMNLTIKVV